MSDSDIIRETVAATLKAVKDGVTPSRDSLIADFHEEAKALAVAPRKNMRMYRQLQEKYLSQDETLTLEDLDTSPRGKADIDWRTR